MLGTFPGNLLRYLLVSALMAALNKMVDMVCWDNIVMGTSRHNDMRIVTDKRQMVMLTIWGDTVLHSNVLGNLGDN